MSQNDTPEPEQPTPAQEEEPDWLTAQPERPEPARTRRADYQEKTLPCDACE